MDVPNDGGQMLGESGSLAVRSLPVVSGPALASAISRTCPVSTPLLLPRPCSPGNPLLAQLSKPLSQAGGPLGGVGYSQPTGAVPSSFTGTAVPSPPSSVGRPSSVASSSVSSVGGLLPGPEHPSKDLIVLLACGANERLPRNADLPADLFTSCLTTPMPMALRWFVRQNRVRRGRRSPVGEWVGKGEAFRDRRG